ncbi:MAG TPA: thioredoxin domain-containing protein [Candidatus Elarobacter sp.]|nr:thioredoxin domain-containing protein [Candidatus Elarobacter sp.]
MNKLAKRFVYIAAWLAIALSPAASRAADGSSLKPPPGARVAIVVFEDLECPDCARAYPVIWDAARKYNIPVVLHDFPLQMHPWSFDAAVFARYFDTKSEKLGDDFRGYIFQNQTQIDKQNLRQWADKFASTNNSPIPFVLDPDGQFKNKIQADRQMGNQIGLQHTPTIFVVGNGGAATPAVEVEDRTKLGQIIEDMLQKAPAAPAAKKPAAKKTTAKKAAKK